MPRLAFTGFHLPGFDFTEFPSGHRVLDVGCGPGKHLEQLAARGCRPVGIDLDGPALKGSRAKGLAVLRGYAERLPFPSDSFEGLLCCVVLPYTDEPLAVGEWGRVLRQGGTARVAVHGLGFSLLQMVRGPWRLRLYGLRSLLNTAYYRVVRRPLPGWIGDTRLQTDRYMRRYFREAGLVVESAPLGRRFLGLPVFLYYVLRKADSR